MEALGIATGSFSVSTAGSRIAGFSYSKPITFTLRNTSAYPVVVAPLQRTTGLGITEIQRSDIAITLQPYRSQSVTYNGPFELWGAGIGGTATLSIGDTLQPSKTRINASYRQLDSNPNGTGAARFNNGGGFSGFTGVMSYTGHPIIFDTDATVGFQLTFTNFYAAGNATPIYVFEMPNSNTITVKATVEIPMEGYTGTVVSSTNSTNAVITIPDIGLESGCLRPLSGVANGFAVRITAGLGVGQTATITNNTTTTLTCDGVFTSSNAPDNTSTFQIVRIVPVTFNGADSVTIAKGGYAVCDPLPYGLTAGQVLYCRTYASCSSGGMIPATYLFAGQTKITGLISETLQDFVLYDNFDPAWSTTGPVQATDMTSSGTFQSFVSSGGKSPVGVSSECGNSSSIGYMYGPAHILAAPINKTKPMVTVISDSTGLDASTNYQFGNSYANNDRTARVLGGFFGIAATATSSNVVMFSRSGARAGELNGPHAKYLTFIAGLSDYVVYNIGVNDINTGSKTAQQLVDRLYAHAKQYVAAGIKTSFCTIYPNVSIPTDKYITRAGQSVPANTGFEAHRRNINSWARGNSVSAITTSLGSVFTGPIVDKDLFADPLGTFTWSRLDATIVQTVTLASESGGTVTVNEDRAASLTTTDAVRDCWAQQADDASKLWRLSGYNTSKQLIKRTSGGTNSTTVGCTINIYKADGTDTVHASHQFHRDFAPGVVQPWLQALPVVRP